MMLISHVICQQKFSNPTYHPKIRKENVATVSIFKLIATFFIAKIIIGIGYLHKTHKYRQATRSFPNNYFIFSNIGWLMLHKLDF